MIGEMITFATVAGPTVPLTWGAAGVVGILGKYLWDKYISTEGKANDRLVDQLSERIAAQEARLVVLEAGMDEERRERRAAEAKVYELTLRIGRLEAELRRHNIQVPE
jgi:hypothetical protein